MNHYMLGEEKFAVELKKAAVTVNGRETASLAIEPAGEGLLIKLDGEIFPAFVCRDRDVFFCWVAGETYRFVDVDQAVGQDAPQHEAGEKGLTAPMPGKVVKVLAKAGDEVKRGAKLLIIESMKMETEIIAPRNGRILAIKYGEGEVFGEGELLVELEQESGLCT